MHYICINLIYTFPWKSKWVGRRKEKHVFKLTFFTGRICSIRAWEPSIGFDRSISHNFGPCLHIRNIKHSFKQNRVKFPDFSVRSFQCVEPTSHTVLTDKNISLLGQYQGLRFDLLKWSTFLNSLLCKSFTLRLTKFCVHFTYLCETL